MVKISKAQGSGAAVNYFEQEYSNARESYYLDGENDEIEGEYFGTLAKELGLSTVTKETFHRLIEGQDPYTGEQRIKHVASKIHIVHGIRIYDLRSFSDCFVHMAPDDFAKIVHMVNALIRRGFRRKIRCLVHIAP